MPYYLYILQSQMNEMYYVGISPNLQHRLEFHNYLGHGFTARYRPWVIVFEKEFPPNTLALKAERKVKSWKSRTMIERFIKGEITLS
jgi:putative endonuclease